MILGAMTLMDTLILALAMMAIMYIAFRPSMRRKKDPLEKPFSISPAQQREVERQMQSVLVEMATMARQISSQIDSRATRLEVLIKEADEKIAQLKRLSSNEPVDNSPATPQGVQRAQEDARHAEVYALADQGLDAVEIAKRIGRQRGEVELILALRGKSA